MSFLLLMMTVITAGQPFEVGQTFENISEASDDFVKMPFDLAHGESGRIFITDAVGDRIHVWEKDGDYAFSFGSKGEGPGQLGNPYFANVHAGRLYVYEDRNRRISIFEEDGTFVSFFRVPIRVQRFGVLNPNLFLVAEQRYLSRTDSRVRFSLINREGEVVRHLQEYTNDLMLVARGGDNNAAVKAYGAEADIQAYGDGTWVYGYGSQKKLHRIDGAGKALGDIHLELVTSPPNEEEIDNVKNMSLPGEGGRRMTLKDLPNIDMRYDRDKAFYTQFTVHNGKAIFALHPMGGTNGVGVGFHQGSYVVCDLATGARTFRGKYAFPEDSRIWFEDGILMGMVINEEEEYELNRFEFPKN